MKIVDFLSFISYKFRDIKIIKVLFSPVYRAYRKKLKASFINKNNTRLKTYGLEALIEFDKCMRENGYTYSLAFGTMLGAVREKGFISHDVDIDVWMWFDVFNNNLINLLENAGFKRQYNFSVRNDSLGREDSFRYKGVQIDIFYVYPPIAGDFSYVCDFITFPDAPSRELSIKKHCGLLPRRIELPISRDIEYIDFETIKLPISINAKEILKCRYGDDFMKPNPLWSAGDENKYTIVWNGQVGVFTKY